MTPIIYARFEPAADPTEIPLLLRDRQAWMDLVFYTDQDCTQAVDRISYKKMKPSRRNDIWEVGGTRYKIKWVASLTPINTQED